MKIAVLLFLGCASILAQSQASLPNNNNELSENNGNSIQQAVLAQLPTGSPNCLNPNNWGRRFRHNWQVLNYWECDRLRAELRSCVVGTLYQPSLERCVLPWNWQWEPIRNNGTTTTRAPTTPPPDTPPPDTPPPDTPPPDTPTPDHTPPPGPTFPEISITQSTSKDTPPPTPTPTASTQPTTPQLIITSTTRQPIGNSTYDCVIW